ncbi:hypothetical protein D9M69_440020 [compost metagenome]
MDGVHLHHLRPLDRSGCGIGLAGRDHLDGRAALQAGSEAADSRAGLRQLLLAQGVGQAHETCRSRAEGFGIEHRDTGGAEQLPGEVQRAEAAAAHIQQHEHAGLRLQHLERRATVQRIQHQVAAAPVELAHVMGHLVVGEHRSQRGLLHEAGQAVEHVQRQVLDMRHQLRASDHPTGAPAGHGVGFGQAADAHGALAHSRQGGEVEVGLFEGEAFVDFVHHHPEVMLARQFGDGFQLAGIEHHAGGVVRIGEEDGAGAFADGRAQGREVRPEAAFGGARHPHQVGAGGLEGGLVGDVDRVEDDDFVPLFQQAPGGGVEAVLRAGHQYGAVGRHRLPGQPTMQVGDGLAQFGTAGHVAVVRVAGLQRLDGGVGDGFGGGDIRVADA